MRFLLLNQFYPPDAAPTGWYLHGLAQELVRRGHSVKVLCSRRSYDGKDSFPRRENLDGVEVSRLPATGFGRRGFVGKMADYGSFYFSLATALLLDRSAPDLILSLTTPPYIGLLGKAAAGKCRCRHAHWIMDLYPDVLFAHRMGSATVPVAVFGVSPNTSLPRPAPGEGISDEVGSGTPATASETLALPGPDPLKTSRLLFRFLRKLTRWQLRGAEAVISLGPYMAERVAAYVEAKAEIAKAENRNEDLENRNEFQLSKFQLSAFDSCAWVPLWSDPELVPWPANEPNPLRAERGWDAKDVVFLYSGNMGLGHRFTEFLETARRLAPKAKAEIGKVESRNRSRGSEGGESKAEIGKVESRNHKSDLQSASTGPRWVFSGGGKRRREIETFAKSHPAARIQFLDYVPQSQLRAHLCAADVHLASLDSAWQGLIVPSKIQASFAVARPVLFVGGRDCETAAWIEESGGGWVVDQDDLDGLLQAIQQALNPAERQRRGQAAFAFARENFQMSENCARIAQLLEDKKQKVESRKQKLEQMKS